MFLRGIERKTKYDRMSNEQIKDMTETEIIIIVLENGQLNRYSHIKAMPTNRLTGRVTEMGIFSKRKRRRWRETWKGRMEKKI